LIVNVTLLTSENFVPLNKIAKVKFVFVGCISDLSAEMKFHEFLSMSIQYSEVITSNEVGLVVGVAVEGAREGIFVGVAEVGACVVGFIEGDLVGFIEGDLVGLRVVGFIEGDLVGSDVGTQL
jgi:hypothetical protein